MNISANLLLSGKADATNRKGAHTPPLERNMDYMKKILVLEDEPSIRSCVVINLRRSGYEPIEAATGEEALEKLMDGRTTIMVAHRLSTIQHADCIMVMHKGRICERGTHRELLEQDGIYRKLYELQIS